MQQDATRWFYQPVTLVLGLVSLLITGTILLLTTQDVSLLRPGQQQFLGWDNYRRLFADSRAIDAFWRTVWFTLGASALEIVFGLAVAVLLDRQFRARLIARSMLLIPIVMTPVVVGLAWRLMFNPNVGIINYWLGLLGVAPVDWLGNPRVAIYALLITDVWQWTPFVALLTLATLEGLPQDPMHAARVDGAREWQLFWFITFPMLKRGLAVVGLIRAIDSIKAFDIFYIMTRGGPSLSTETLNLYGYISAFTDFNISYSLTMAIVLTVFTNLALLGVYAVITRSRPG